MAKRARVDEDDNVDELVDLVWDHYRNYLDSFDADDGNGDGDVDELRELIDIAKKRISKPPLHLESNTDDDPLEIDSVVITCPVWESRKDMLPILLSVAYYHLADDAISEYLEMMRQPKKQQSCSLSVNQGDNGCLSVSPGSDKALENAQNLIIQSLEWYPHNAATWSMGANFGRISTSLSLSSSRSWYEIAVKASTFLRERAIEALYEESIANKEKEWIELLVLNQILGVEYQDQEDEMVRLDDQNGSDNKVHDSDDVQNNVHDDEEEGDEEDEEDTGYYSASTVESTSRFMCAMLWSMVGRHDRALDHLKPFRLTHRLHPNVWNIAQPLKLTFIPPTPSKPPLVFQPEGGILPKSLYDSMLKIFAPDASYWNESDYSTRGYYSFFESFDSLKKQPRNLIEEVIINHLLPRAQQCLDMIQRGDEKAIHDGSNKICGFEWWAHTRPIQANLGHNLHFDTDESTLDQEGKITHPVLSSVLYLTGGSENSSSPAGATIILDETPDSTTLGKKCWQGVPKDNTFLIFPGDRLHGVLPCPGIQNQSKEDGDEKSSTLDIKRLIYDWDHKKATEMAHTETISSEDPPNRLTFMVGFWTRNVPATMKSRRLYGPCGPLPPPTEDHTWVSEIMQGYDERNTEQRPVADKIMEVTALSQVSPAWEIIEDKKTDNNNPMESYPAIPHGIDHRFFVHGAPSCFRRSLFEDREINRP